MNCGISALSIIPVRKEPSSRSEMVTQLLFGETYDILEETEDWILIKTHTENYEGWISANQFTSCNSQQGDPQLLNKFPFIIAIHERSGNSLYLMPGSILYNLKWQGATEASFTLNHQVYKVQMELKDIQPIPVTSIRQYSSQFLLSPYLWGGRTMWGIDCSGLTQIIYKVCGIQIPRDAWQQAEVGESVGFINETRLGDLAFFDNEQGKITHVGMIMEPGLIIHASGKVRTDILDSYGIFDEAKGKHTHKLRFVKRILL